MCTLNDRCLQQLDSAEECGHSLVRNSYDVRSVHSGVARIWCQEGHTSYWMFTRDDCQHIVAVRLCISQSKYTGKKIKLL